MGLRDGFLPEHLHRLLSRERLGEMSVQGLHELVVLGAKQRHVRHHDQGVDGRGRCLRWEHVLVADSHKGLLRARRSEVGPDPVKDAPRGAAQSRVALVPRLREGGGGRFANDGTRATHEVVVRRLFAGQLEQEFPIIVLGEQTGTGRDGRGPAAASRGPIRIRGGGGPRRSFRPPRSAPPAATARPAWPGSTCPRGPAKTPTSTPDRT